MKYFLVLFLFSGLIFAKTLFLDTSEEYLLESSYEYSDTFSLDRNVSFKQFNSALWVENKSELTTATDKPYWIHVSLKNTISIKRKMLLMSERGYVFSLDYYLVQDGKILTHDSDDLYRRSQTAPFKTSHRIFSFEIDKQEKLDIYFKVENCNRLDISFKLVSYKYLSEYYTYYHFFQGIFFTTIFIMALYSLNLFLLLRYRPYLYYLFYSIALILYQASYFGYFHLLSDLSGQSIFAILILSSVTFIIALIFFVIELFELKKIWVKLNYGLISLIVFLFFSMIGLSLAVFQHNHYYAEVFFNFINLSVPIYVFFILMILYYISYKKQNRFALWYAVGWSFLAFFGLLLILHNLGIFTQWKRIEYLFEIATMIESILLSTLLAFQIKEIKKKIQERELAVLRQNRLSSMGEMIGLIGHQWRQPLAVINGSVLNLDINLSREGCRDTCYVEHLDRIEERTKYLSGVINQFMTFFTSSNKRLEEFSVEELMKESKEFTLKGVATNVEFSYQYHTGLTMVGYRSYLLQLFSIVIENALEAFVVSNVNRPKIIFKIKEKKEYFEMNIENNGGCIDKEILDKIFDPYFTTKHHYEGTGMGLYILKMIVEKSMLGSVEIKNINNGVSVQMEIGKFVL